MSNNEKKYSGQLTLIQGRAFQVRWELDIFIRARSLNHRQFKTFSPEEADAEFNKSQPSFPCYGVR